MVEWGLCGTDSIQKMRHAVVAAKTLTPTFKEGGRGFEYTGYYDTYNNRGISDSGVYCAFLAESENVRND